jgi:hypothetical protein
VFDAELDPVEFALQAHSFLRFLYPLPLRYVGSGTFGCGLVFRPGCLLPLSGQRFPECSRLAL